MTGASRRPNRETGGAAPAGAGPVGRAAGHEPDAAFAGVGRRGGVAPAAAAAPSDEPAGSRPATTTPRWLVLAAASALVLAIVGLVRPDTALRAAIALGLLTAGLALVGAIRDLLRRVPLATPPPTAPPPAQPWAATTDPDLPWHYVGLVTPGWAPPDLLTPGVQTALRTIATERLWERHRLNVWLPDHGPAIAAILSPSLWLLINPMRPMPIQADAYRRFRLRGFLDELEAL